MEKLSKLAYRYANALLRAIEQHTPDEIDRAQISLTAFADAWQSNNKFRYFVMNPLIPTASRRAVIEQTISALSFSEHVSRFLSIVFERNRSEHIVDMSNCFSHLVDRRRQIVDVKITSAFALSDQDKEQISAKLRKNIRGTPRYHFHSMPELIGGLVIEFDGKLLDGSLRTRLTQMQKELTK